MKNRKGQAEIIWTIVLIITGLLVLLSSFDIITINDNIYFYAAIGVMGVVFHILCFVSKPKKYNLLVPGGMLLIYAALFIAKDYTGIFTVDTMWPVIILAAAFGMLEQRVFSKGTEGSWLSIITVAVIGFYFLIQNDDTFSKVFGILLILAGILLIIKVSRKLPVEEAEEIKEDLSDLDAIEVPAVPQKIESVAVVEPIAETETVETESTEENTEPDQN